VDISFFAVCVLCVFYNNAFNVQLDSELK